MENRVTLNKSTVFSCLIWVVICLAISGIAGWVTEHNIADWYVHLNKPSFNPPNWVFGPVWTVLYIMIGITGGLLWQRRQSHRKAFALFVIQLVLNFIWSFLFFGMQNPGLAAIDIIALWLFIALTIVYTWPALKSWTLLLLPYFLWASFACILNISIWMLNS